MSFDEGFNPEMTSDEDFQAKFAALLQEHNLGLPDLCVRAGVPYATAYEAIKKGAYGLHETQNTLHRLLQVFGLGIDYLLVGMAPATGAPKFQPHRNEPESEASAMDRRRRVRTLAWDFCIRANITRSHRRALATYCVSLVDGKPTHTLLKAARHRVPRTVTDVAYIYDQLLRDGFFQGH